jgi:hypothetical protein
LEGEEKKEVGEEVFAGVEVSKILGLIGFLRTVFALDVVL